MRTDFDQPNAPERPSRSSVDQARVAQLRAALEAGEYRTDPEAIAAAMVARDLPPGD